MAYTTTSTMLLSPLSSGSNRALDAPLPFQRNPSISDFQIERIPKQTQVIPRRATIRRTDADYEDERVFQSSVARVLAAKTRPFTVSGRIPLDQSTLVLFFRSKTGITHSLDFPIDVEFETPPALDVLIAACKPYQTSDYDDYPDRESLFYPPNLPVTTTFEISNHPILEAIKNTLFPNLPEGNYLTVVRDSLEVLPSGGRTSPHQRSLNDGRVATVVVTLPVRFRGGSLIVYDTEGNQEKFYGRGGKIGDMEWTAFLADCDYEVETVQKGCRISLSYAVFLKTFGPASAHPDPLINPSENFLDLLSPVLNMSRGRKLGFYLANDYGVNPSESVAGSLVPKLKGGDSLLYHALKLFKLVPELHWTAGSFIWPVDRAVECGSDHSGDELANSFSALQVGVRRPRGAFSAYNEVGDDVADNLRWRVEDSGAMPLAESDILVLTPWNGKDAVGKERVPFVSRGELEKLVVNVLLVAYVP